MKAFVSCLILLFACPVVWAQGNVWSRSGLDSLNISALAVDPTNPNTIYAGTNGQGRGFQSSGTGVHVFKSTNAGISWNEVSNGLPSPPSPGDPYPRQARVTALVVDPSNPNTIYAAIVSLYWAPPWVHDAPSVFKSTDGGANWVASDNGLPVTVWDFTLAIDPNNPSTLYAASGYSDPYGLSFQVFKSTDGATTWFSTVGSTQATNEWGLPYNFHASLAIDPRNSATVYVGLYNVGIYKSTDAGATWSRPITGTRVPSGDPFHPTDPALAGVYVMAVDPQSPDTIYVGTGNLCGCMDEPTPAGLWKSSDGGENWNATNSPYSPGEYYGVGSIAIHPKSTGTVYASSGSVFKSTDGGEDWTPFSDGLQSGASSLVFSSSNVLYAGTGLGLYKITDPVPALSLVSQYCATSPWKLSVSNGTPNTSIRLKGISNDQTWEVVEWGRTDANGSYVETGTFTAQVLGRHTLTVDVGGANSNSVSFVVSNCNN